MIHHIELWVPNLTRAEASWGWLLVELGYQPYIQWPEGQSWRAGPSTSSWSSHRTASPAVTTGAAPE